MGLLGSMANRVMAVSWPGMPKGMNLGHTPSSVLKAFETDPLGFMAHFWVITLIVALHLAVALLLPLFGGLHWWKARRSGSYDFDVDSPKRKKKIAFLLLKPTFFIIAMFVLIIAATEFHEFRSKASQMQPVANEFECKTGDCLNKIVYEEIPLEALQDSERLIKEKLAELAKDFNISVLQNMVKKQDGVIIALTKMDGMAKQVTDERKTHERMLREIKEIIAVCPNCHMCPPKAFFDADADLVKTPEHCHVYSDLNEMTIDGELIAEMWDQFGLPSVSEQLNNVIKEMEQDFNEQTKSSSNLLESVGEEGEKVLNWSELFSSPALDQWLGDNYVAFSIYSGYCIIGLLLAYVVLCLAISMIDICFEEKMSGWPLLSRIAATVKASCSAISTLLLPLISLSMVIVCVHFVASSFGHNMACNVSSPEAKAVEMEKFELQFKEICTNYAQNLREKTAAIKFDSSSDEWQSGEKYTYRSMATGQWYSTIIKLDFELRSNKMSILESDLKGCWSRIADYLRDLDPQNMEVDGNVLGRKLSTSDTSNYELVKEDLLKLGTITEELMNLGFQSPIWARDIEFFIQQHETAIAFTKQAPGILRELPSAFERKCRFLVEKFIRADVTGKAHPIDNGESVHSTDGSCSDVYGSLNVSWMSLMLGIVTFILPPMIAAILEKKWQHVKSEIPAAAANVMEMEESSV